MFILINLYYYYSIEYIGKSFLQVVSIGPNMALEVS